jgi:hypothetical protein
MKKQWISVKCGLSRDPKHRQAMGESIWLFLHILDCASWDDGIVHDWKDEAEAEEMGMPVRTLREHRRKLDELGYIDCKQKQYTQDIIIRNWTNPREYSGKVYNKPQSDTESEASNPQGYIQGYIQGNRKDVTPTLESKNQITKEKPDILDGMLYYGKQAIDSGENEIEQIAVKLETGLRFNFPRGTKDQAVYRRILKSGKPVERFIEWVKSDEKRLSFAFLYAKDTETIWRDWPQVENSAANNPQGLEVGI